MIALKASQDKVLAVLMSVSGIVERRHTIFIPVFKTGITNGFPEQGGGGADCAGAAEGAGPDVAQDDDDGDGDGDPDSDWRRQRSKNPTPKPPAPPPPAALLPVGHAAHYVAVGRSRIYQLAAAGEFPQPIKVGRSVRWIRAELDAWIAAQAARRSLGTLQ